MPLFIRKCPQLIPYTLPNVFPQTLADRLHTALHVPAIQPLEHIVYSQGTNQVSSSSEFYISRHLQHNLGSSMEFQSWQGKVKGYQVGLDSLETLCPDCSRRNKKWNLDHGPLQTLHSLVEPHRSCLLRAERGTSSTCKQQTRILMTNRS